MSSRIGIVGCSAEGAALCYRTICIEGAALLGPHAHPEISMHTHSLADYVVCLDRGDLTGVADLMLSSAGKLAAAGADFLICPDNTIHQAMRHVLPRSPRPWLHCGCRGGGGGPPGPSPSPADRNALAGRERHLSGQPLAPRRGVQPSERGRGRGDRPCDHVRACLRPVQPGRGRDRPADHVAHAAGRLRRRHPRLHRDPVDHERRELALPTPDSTRLLARAALARAIDPGS